MSGSKYGMVRMVGKSTKVCMTGDSSSLVLIMGIMTIELSVKVFTLCMGGVVMSGADRALSEATVTITSSLASVIALIMVSCAVGMQTGVTVCDEDGNEMSYDACGVDRQRK
jgi:hypothetical protein